MDNGNVPRFLCLFKLIKTAWGGTKNLPKMKKFVTILLLCVTFTAMAQLTLKDAIYLKDGSVIKGTIIEYIPKESLKIKTADGSIFSHNLDEIIKFTREEVAESNPNVVAVAPAIITQQPNNSYAPQQVYQNAPQSTFGYDDDFKTFSSSIEVGSSVGSMITGFSVDYVARYNIIPQFSVGLGTGIGTLLTEGMWEYPTITVPIFVSVKSTIFKSRISPFASADIGTIGMFSTYGDGGSNFDFYFKPMVGVDFKTKGSRSISVGVGYLLIASTSQACFKVGFNF